MAARFLRFNLLQTPGAVIAPSSQLASMPGGNLLKPGASVRLRFAGPWVIVFDENDIIPFSRGVAEVARIATGIYTTPAAMGAAIVAAMEAEDAAPAWACAYTANKFVISNTSAHSFTLDFGTSSWAVGAVAPCIGFAMVDTSSATTHTADEVSYQSRHWIKVDLGSALPFTAAIVRGHNVSASGTVRLQADSSPIDGGQLINESTLDFAQTLPASGDDRSLVFASITKRYMQLVIDDVQNPVGFNELGIWWPGLIEQPTISPDIQYAKDNEHLSGILYADGGANHQIPRARRRVYRLIFKLEERAGLAVADRALFDAIDELGIGTNMFILLEVLADPTLTIYGFNRVGLHEVYVAGTLWAIVMEFAEALG